MKRLFLNTISLAIAAAQCALSVGALLLLWFSNEISLSPFVCFLLSALCLGGVFLLTKFDAVVRGYAYDGNMIFWICFAVSPIRVVPQAFTIVGIVLSFFTGHKDFANLGYSPLYPVSCLVFALTSLDYMTATDKVRLGQRLDNMRERQREQSRQRAAQAAAERERVRNLQPDTNLRGFLSTTFLPNGMHIYAGGRRHTIIKATKNSISFGRPCIEVWAYAPFDSYDLKGTTMETYSEYKEWLKVAVELAVKKEIEKNFGGYTRNYSSCPAFRDVQITVYVSW